MCGGRHHAHRRGRRDGAGQCRRRSSSCDPAVVQAALTKAEADARAAQKAYVTHTRTAMKALVKQVKVDETAEARAAARKAGRLTAAAAKDPALRDAAKAARATARVEAKEAARAQRASFATLQRQVKADRATLKAAWNTAKADLATQKQIAEDCAEVPEPPVVEAPAPA
ncbi:hypothetical protein [Aeromicrobium sp. Leaf245]|uniref:hypothetical protein n=1 Tax=Aeromicrobium sp. Leaf245 TaxID=1736306 RepID=UPI0012E1774E|nr:hypothetical protein [Aeromicrobium sp. Leaf245]